LLLFFVVVVAVAVVVVAAVVVVIVSWQPVFCRAAVVVARVRPCVQQ
jgi:hypothetical protein